MQRIHSMQIANAQADYYRAVFQMAQDPADWKAPIA